MIRKITFFALISCVSFAVHATGDWCAVVKKTPDGFVNLRSGTGIGYSVVGRVKRGQLLSLGTEQCRDDFGELLCDESMKWSFVQDNPKGWINARYLTQVECKDE